MDLSARHLWVGGLLIAAGLTGLLLGGNHPVPLGTQPAHIHKDLSEWLDVHVAGWVVVPGVVSVARGSKAVDAIAAAGGLRPGAASEMINLAAEVHQGDQIVVPGPDEGGVGEIASVLSLNSATASELQALPGVGPVLAEKIVAFRAEHGRFSTVDDLLGVPGIGEAKLASIRDLVRP